MLKKSYLKLTVASASQWALAAAMILSHLSRWHDYYDKLLS
ncbi:hypothetical protein SeseC_01733 [Streptococcus equi subsp. zooepidemicus ATCC 35246]|nr:hypothetical protein SeseC_01733 [Streptococcus equi subsp. zooepidemicus ATCC 35246]